MNNSFRRISGGLKTAGELIRSMWRGPYWWLVPLVMFLLPAALVFVLMQASPLAAPFVYVLF